MQKAFVYDGKFSAHRRRVHGRSTEGLSGHRFLGYLQNHDQIGNRAKGERSSPGLMSLGQIKNRRGAGFDLAVRAVAFSRRGMGARARRFFILRIIKSRNW